MKFFRKSLMARLVSCFLFLSLLSVILTGYVVYIQATGALKDSVFERLESIAAFKADSLNLWIEDQRVSLTLLAWLPDVRNHTEILVTYPRSAPEYQSSYETLSEYLNFVASRTSDTKELFILDSNGNIIFSTDKTCEGQSRSSFAYFSKGRSVVCVQNVYISPISGKPAITIATPLFSRTGKRIGVLASHLNLLRMNRLFLERTGMGKTGETYLVDKNRHFVSDTLYQPDNKDSYGIEQALQGHRGTGLYLNYASIPVAGVYRWLNDRDMALLSEMNQTEAFALPRRLAWVIFFVGILMAVILAAGVYLMARRIASPVLAIADTAAKVAAGDLTREAEVCTEDEIGIMAKAFNQMTRQLRESIIHLEERVAERTHTLEQEITVRKRIEKDLHQAKDAAESANRAKSTFLANMSHELRSPLTAILGFARAMTRSRTLPKEHRENADIITRSGEHLLTLINQVLDLSKIEAGRMTVRESSFDLHLLTEDTEDMFRLRARDKHLQLLFERSPDVPRYVKTDEVKLRQVLINLLSNAVKFTKEGGIAVRVKAEQLSDCPDSFRIHFEVQDTGSGIAPDELDKLFEAFVQTNSGRQSQEGTGLGLAISRKFVQLMGGEMTVKSEPGRGSVFSFSVRAVKTQSADGKMVQTVRHVTALEPGQPRYRILIVDDSADNRTLLAKLLAPLGFGIREAENGRQAVEIWEQWEPHLIWMDMRMPVMDGYEAAQKIRSTVKGQAVAVIALTASALEEEKALVLSAGCDDFLRKPYKESQIFEAMEKHLGIGFVWEQDLPEEEKPGQKENAKILTAELLSVLPPELLSALEQAAIRGDSVAVEHLIDQIRSSDAPLADALKALADDFEYDRILELVIKRI